MEDKITLDVKVDETTGEHYLEFPPNFLPKDWKENTPLEWIDNKDGSWTIRKKRKFVLVECIDTFRKRYVVEIPEDAKCDSITYARDSVAMEECVEFSQQYLGETIVSSREITEDEVISMCDTDNEYVKQWNTEKKFKSFVTEVKEDDER